MSWNISNDSVVLELYTTTVQYQKLYTTTVIVQIY